jgi:hypothetical protein
MISEASESEVDYQVVDLGKEIVDFIKNHKQDVKNYPILLLKELKILLGVELKPLESSPHQESMARAFEGNSHYPMQKKEQVLSKRVMVTSSEDSNSFVSEWIFTQGKWLGVEEKLKISPESGPINVLTAEQYVKFESIMKAIATDLEKVFLGNE